MDGGLVAIAGAVAINALYAIRHGHTIYVVLTGGVILAFFVAVLGQVGQALAYTFLLGTVVYRSQDLFTVATGLLSPKKGSTDA